MNACDPYKIRFHQKHTAVRIENKFVYPYGGLFRYDFTFCH